MDKRQIKTIEDLSLNAWPSYQMQLFDGWILRYSCFYTHRTNCVEQIGASGIPADEKIAYCEKIYRRWKTPCIFKITPLIDPEFDKELAGRGYHIEHETSVMYRELPQKKLWSEDNGVRIERRIPDEWIDALFDIKGNATVRHLKIVPSMYAAIPKDVLCASVCDGDRIIATGLGILDRDHIGIYAINVQKEYRRQGFARKICESLLQTGINMGITKTYLQVVSDNVPAIALYESLGLRTEYKYWFRVSPPETGVSSTA